MAERPVSCADVVLPGTVVGGFEEADMGFATLTLEREGAVARITFTRPKAFNALNFQMASELRSALLEVQDDAAVRAVLLTGAGKAYCAGGDVGSFQAALPNAQPMMKDIVHQLHDAVGCIVTMDKPVVAAVNGVVAGAGMGLAMAPDVAVAGQSARFSMAYTGIGASPDGSSTYFLPRLVGSRRAMELILTNRALSAEEALQWGLVNQVVADDALDATALALAQKLAAGPTRAYGRAKRLVHQSLNTALEAQLAAEGRGIVEMAATNDFAEGVGAFAEKRKPAFKGN